METLYGWRIINGKELKVAEEKEYVFENTINDMNTNNKLSDKWEDCEFLYNGKKIELMCDFSNLGKVRINEEDMAEMVISEFSCAAWKGFRTYVLNNSEEIKNVLECKIYGFKAWIRAEFYEEEPYTWAEIQLPKGITWKSTLEDIIKAYGEPKEKIEKQITDDDMRLYLSYEADDGSSMKLEVKQDYGLIGIDYFIKSEK